MTRGGRGKYPVTSHPRWIYKIIAKLKCHHDLCIYLEKSVLCVCMCVWQSGTIIESQKLLNVIYQVFMINNKKKKLKRPFMMIFLMCSYDFGLVSVRLMFSLSLFHTHTYAHTWLSLSSFLLAVWFGTMVFVMNDWLVFVCATLIGRRANEKKYPNRMYTRYIIFEWDFNICIISEWKK